MKKRGFFLIVTLFLTACNIGTEFIERFQTAILQQQSESIQVGEGLAPDFSFTAFDGQNYTLSDFRGQVVVLNFWASWCGPCYGDTPILEALWHKYRDQGVVVIGLTYVDMTSAAISYLEANNVTYINGVDTDSMIVDAYSVLGIPETFIIDRQGNIAYRVRDSLQTDQMFNAILDQILAKP